MNSRTSHRASKTKAHSGSTTAMTGGWTLVPVAVHGLFTPAGYGFSQGSSKFHLDAEGRMATDKNSISLKLTPEQQAQIRAATGKLGDTLEFSIEELEERIAPSLPRPHISGFHTP